MRNPMSGIVRKLKTGFCELPIDKIGSDGGGAINQRHVKALAESIAVDGLLCPISVTTGAKIVCGRHRLHACRLLGWKKIPAVVVDFDAIHAELAEIDENVIRKDLSAIERSKALARRKELYEALHPETGQGKAPGAGRGKGKAAIENGQGVRVPTFAADTAAATGQSERQIRRDVAIGIGIPDDVAEMISDSKIADNKKQLTELAKLEGNDQRAVAELIVEGKAKTVKAALKAIHPVDDADESPVDTAAVTYRDTATALDAEEGRSGGGAPPQDRIVWVIEELDRVWNDYVGTFGDRAERYTFVAGIENWKVRSE